jgi:hypothetical protein
MDQTVIISLPIDPAPTFEADVAIELPGSRAQAVLRFEFRHLTRDELVALDRAYMGMPELGAPADAAPPPPMSDGDLLERVIKRWTVGPVDADQRPIAYSRAALERLINAYPAATSAIYTRHQQELREARVKNSGRQPGR